jgi:small ligand-binding sensory domain FIST
MPSLSSTSPRHTTGFVFAASLSRKADTEAAARDLADEIQAKLGASPVDLACLFFSSHHSGQARLLAETLVGRLQPRLMIGCSGEGVIAGAEELETAPAVALWTASLPAVTVEPVRLTFSPEQDRFSLSGWPDPDTPDASFLLLADPFTTPMQEVLAMLEHRYPGTAAIGGLAGGGQDAGENRLVLQDDVLENGLVGVRLSGPLDIRPIISQGCRPIGDRYVVTKAEHNLIHELSGAPALQRLQSVFESLGGEDRRRGDQATGAVAIGDVVQEGQTVQFHLRDAQSASEDLNLLLAADRAHHRNPPLGALMFSCCGRGQGLFGRLHHDSGTVAERLGAIPLAGFFAQGEIGPVGGRNFLHGYTASLAIFADRAAGGDRR